MSGIHLETILPGAYDRREILRYAMLPKAQDVPDGLPLEECLHMAGDGPVCHAVWREFPVCEDQGLIDLGFARTESDSLRRWISGCDRVVLFAITAGMDMDRLILRAQAVSPLHGLLMHAVGAERVEAACDRLCGILADRMPNRQFRPRFSPGYGDLPLSLQVDVFRALECEKRLGLTLTDKWLMQPGKSVTALVGSSERRKP